MILNLLNETTATAAASSINNDLIWKMFIAILEIIVTFIVGSIIKRIIYFLARKARNKGVLTFLGSFCNIFFKILGVIIALDQIGVSMNLIIGALSALGVGISLALKDNMSSIASGLQILLTRPFKVGDYIKIGHHEGQVRSVEMTYTTLMTPGNQTIIVPNNSLIIKDITNYSSSLNRKIEIQYPCAVDQIDTCELMLIKASEGCDLVLKDPVPTVSILSYSLKGAILQLECYTKHDNYAKCYGDLMHGIYEVIKDTGKQPHSPEEDKNTNQKEKTDLSDGGQSQKDLKKQPSQKDSSSLDQKGQEGDVRMQTDLSGSSAQTKE